MMEPLKIKPVPVTRRIWSTWRGKKENKKRLMELAGYNLALWSADRILSAIGANQVDLAALALLAAKPDGWHNFIFSNDEAAYDFNRLACLGLVCLKWRQEKIFLTDGGRYLLSLTPAISTLYTAS